MAKPNDYFFSTNLWRMNRAPLVALLATLAAPALAEECADYRAAVGEFVRSGAQFLRAQAERNSAEAAWLRKKVARATDAYNYEKYLDQRKRHQESKIELEYRLDLLMHRHRHPRTRKAAARMTAIARKAHAITTAATDLVEEDVNEARQLALEAAIARHRETLALLCPDGAGQ